MWILKLEMAHKEAVCIREKEWGDSETAVLHISTFVFLFQQFQSPLIPFL